MFKIWPTGPRLGLFAETNRFGIKRVKTPSSSGRGGLPEAFPRVIIRTANTHRPLFTLLDDFTLSSSDR